MNILFDLTPLESSGPIQFHGGAEYAKLVLKKLLDVRHGEEISCTRYTNTIIDQETETLLRAQKIVVYTLTTPNEFTDLLKKLQPDVFYTSEGHRYADTNFGTTKFICTLHGIRSLEVPFDETEPIYSPSLIGHLRYYKKRLLQKHYLKTQKTLYGRLFENVHTLIVSSLHTKKILLTNFPILAERADSIVQLYPPRKVRSNTTQTNILASQDVLKRFGMTSKEYFLISGGGRWVKNAYRALQALDSLYDDFPTLQKKTLVLGTLNASIFMKHIRHHDRFVFSDYVDETTLNTLYTQAFLFIFPTLSEGFGYAPLESMHHGTPVVCSSASAVPEVCGSAALYFDPRSIDSIKSCVVSMVRDTNVYDHYKREVQKRSVAIEQQQDVDTNKLAKIILQRDMSSQ